MFQKSTTEIQSKNMFHHYGKSLNDDGYTEEEDMRERGDG